MGSEEKLQVEDTQKLLSDQCHRDWSRAWLKGPDCRATTQRQAWNKNNLEKEVALRKTGTHINPVHQWISTSWPEWMLPKSYCFFSVNKLACNLLAKHLKKSTQLHKDKEMTEFISYIFVNVKSLIWASTFARGQVATQLQIKAGSISL